MLLLPAIDLLGGRCVRLLRGDFAAATHYELEAHELLARYHVLGASWVHVVDLDGAKDGESANRAVVLAMASQRAVKLQVGGGVRSAPLIEELLERGVERVVIGSAAVERPAEVRGWLARFGPERICLAFDVRLDAHGEPRVRTHGWTQGGALGLWEALEPFGAHRLRHVLCTDIGRDGALTGPNLTLYHEAVRRHPELAWQASGGVRDAADLAALAATGVAAAVSGRALLDERMSAKELRPFLPNASFPASMSATGRS
jgi:phosphoribosylformimino-5-aminoimidazole carboxamide ribotide isomerase